MSSVEGENGSVRYSVKELFGRIDAKLDVLATLIDAKADHDALVSIDARVATLENDQAYARGLGKAAWAICGLLLAIAGLLVPIVLHVT